MKLTTIVSTLLLAGVLTAAPADKKTTQTTEVKDPVCGMTVDPKTAEKAEYKGKTYYFCSREEKETFQKTPEKFVAAAKKPEKK
jgi:YHS domain-containing protein